jgi:hypothetical protein
LQKLSSSPEFRASTVFLIAAGLRLIRRFLPLPCDSTVYCYFHYSLSEHKTNLRRESRIKNQVELFIELSDVQEGGVVSVAVDAMAMNPNRSCLAAKPVIICSYIMPSRWLDRRSVWRCTFSVMPQGRPDRTCSTFSMTFAGCFLIDTLKTDIYVPTAILATTNGIMNFPKNGISPT